jgi:hypothetical protein
MREKNTNRSETIINKPSDIPKGLVAKRKAELLLAKLEESLKLQNPINKEEILQKSDESESLNSKLVHPTRDRPQIKHRPPSLFNYSNSAKTLFASSNIKISEDSASSNSNDVVKNEDNPPSSIWTDLIKALSRAVDNYTKGRMEGTTPSEAYGWFSWLRHGKSGETKAVELHDEARDTSTVDALLTVLHLFFLDSNTRFNNHSLAPYVVDELNKLLIQYALKPFILKLGAQYDINSWLHIKKQINEFELREENQENQSLHSLK